ncbi:NAD(P)-dependent oxidoreductase [Nonomuraea guangzhouensis]|uniref:NAD(P)-dependent oxidoreductase n=1 Tax=Nonomuraea guangzhouensis TaxID=1291555 RepID=A0ABW4GDY4_9ACTN|nr:NAD(P)-dependent oxidoreductase [Nonomuraea guangzhouensis]
MPGDVTLTGAVMAHPKRREAAIRLAGGVLDVVTDPDPGGRPSAFRTSLLAWSSIPEGATHHVLLHDDMVLSGTFFERATLAAQAMPDAALALFAFWNSRNGAAVRLGALAGARWVRGAGEYTPVAALLLPRRVAEGYVEWARDRGDTWPDDVLMGRYLRQAGVPVYVAVPSLAEHEDLASLVENDFQGLRRSPCFFADDPLSREDRLLGSLAAIPFFKRGVAQCAVPGASGWRDIRCEDYLDGRGFDVGALRAGFDGPWWPLWLTAFTMGVVGSNAGDPRVMDRALGTMGPGGLCHELGSRELARLSDELLDVARAGLAAGLAASPQVVERATVAVTGADTWLREQVTWALADRGFVAAGDPDAVVHVCALDGDPEEEVRLARLAFSGFSGFGGRKIVVGSCGMEVEDAVVLRLGEPYGPGMPQGGIVADSVLRSSLNRPLRAGDGVVQLVHVRDVAAAVIAALTRGAGVYDIAGPEPVSGWELAKAVAKAVRPVPIEAAVSAVSGGAVVSVERAFSELGWRPEVELDYGLHTCAQWLAYESDRQ